MSMSLVSSMTTTYRVRVALLYTMLGVVLTDMSTPMLKTVQMLVSLNKLRLHVCKLAKTCNLFQKGTLTVYNYFHI